MASTVLPRKSKQQKSTQIVVNEVVEELSSISPESNPTEVKKKRKSKKLIVESQQTSPILTAIVVGGTGAVGRYVVQELLASDAWHTVIVVGRRSGVPKYYPESSKLVEVITPLDGMCETMSEVWSVLDRYRPTAAFCCLGTTKEAAKSKSNFKLVDYTYVTDFGWVTRQFGVPSFNLISSVGAGARSPFLYPRTKGKSEKYIKALCFPKTVIYRPGLLGRDEPTSIERWYGKITSALPAAFFAKVIVGVATEDVTIPTKGDSGGNPDTQPSPPVVRTWDNDKIYTFAKTHHISRI